MHQLVLVFLPAHTKAPDIEEAVGKAMEPFDMELEVEECEDICDCVGRKAQHDAEIHANKFVSRKPDEGTRLKIERADARNWTLSQMNSERPLTEEEQAEQRQLVLFLHSKDAVDSRIYQQRYQEALSKHPLKDKPDPDCTECEGTGIVVFEANPNGYWDWWVIGGRFDGFFDAESGGEAESIGELMAEDGEYDSEDYREDEHAEWDGNDGEGEEEDNDEYEGNVIAVRKIPTNWMVPYAVVAHGEWLQQEHGQSKEDWAQTYRELLLKHQDDIAVVCDAHG